MSITLIAGLAIMSLLGLVATHCMYQSTTSLLKTNSTDQAYWSFINRQTAYGSFGGPLKDGPCRSNEGYWWHKGMLVPRSSESEATS